MSLLYIFPLTTFGLGCWQLHRLRWKLDLIQSMKQRVKEDPAIPFPNDLPTVSKEWEYTRVSLKGQMIPQTFLLGPRSMAEQDDGGGKVFSRTPKVGYYVISPLQMAQRRILVNRGWVSRTDLVKELLMEDKVEMEGLLRCGDTKSTIGPENRPEQNEWYWLDVNAMAALSGSDPILVEQVQDVNPMTQPSYILPRHSDQLIGLRNQHLEYAVTWFGLTIASTLMIRYRKKLHF